MADVKVLWRYGSVNWPVHCSWDIKGPLKNYVIPLGGWGEVTKRLHKIKRGRGDTPKDYIGLQGGPQFGSTLA